MIGILAVLMMANYVVGAWTGLFWPNFAFAALLTGYFVLRWAKKVRDSL